MIFHFCLGCCRNYVWAVSHVTVCRVIKAFGGEVVLDEIRSEILIFLETQKTEVRIGVVEDRKKNVFE